MTSPETVVALALAGTVDFDPVTDTLTNDAGEQVKLIVPVGEELPAQGFDPGENAFIAGPRRTVRASRSWSGPTPTGSSSSSRSTRGTARTSSNCRSW